jgi:glycosyltransferase involved in cell wall biosynthesis
MLNLLHGAVRRVYHWMPEGLRRRLRASRLRGLYHRLFPAFAPRRAPLGPADADAACAYPEGRRPTLVCLPQIDWFYRLQRPQHLLARLAARGWRVVHIDPRLDGAPYDPGAASFAGRWTAPLTDNVVGLKLPAAGPADVYGGALAPKQARRLADAFAEAVGPLGLAGATLLTQLPFWAPLAARLRDLLGGPLVYEVVDLHAGFANSGPGTDAAEAALLADADLVVAASASLFEAAAPRCRRAVLIPNGCDPDHFADAPPCPRLAALPRPILGYFGALDDWFDAGLIAAAARARPGASFVLVGQPSDRARYALRRLGNVHLVGERPYAVLPRYLAAFDVCLIPFRRTPLTLAASPVKLFEYLSAGKPVVSARLPEVEAFADVVRLADTPAELLAAVDAALAEGDAGRDGRRRVARANGWDERADRLDAALRGAGPRASVVLVVRDDWPRARATLDSLFRAEAAGPAEVVVVEDGSADAASAALYGYACQRPSLKAVYLDGGVDADAAADAGLRRACGDVLVLLAAGVVVTPGWLRGLARRLEEPGVGLAVPRVAAGGGLDDLLRRAARHRRDDAGATFPPPAGPPCCLAMRREAYLAAGGLEAAGGVAGLVRRAGERGWRLAGAADVLVRP